MTFIESMRSTQATAKNEILSGLTVALAALVPEAIAFSLIADVSPLVGLYSAFISGLVTALLGGRPGMISGATGTIAVVIVSLVARHGTEYLFAAVVLRGLIQIVIGQSIINVSSGGRKRLSGVVASATLLLFILVAAPLVEKIPMATLVGLMFMVAIGTFEWASLNIIRKVPAADVFVMVIVAGVTVVFHKLAVDELA